MRAPALKALGWFVDYHLHASMRGKQVIGAHAAQHARTNTHTHTEGRTYTRNNNTPNLYWRTRELTSAPGRQGTSGPTEAQGEGRGTPGETRQSRALSTLSINPKGKPSCVDLLVAFRPQVETASKCSHDGFEHVVDLVFIITTWHKASLGS